MDRRGFFGVGLLPLTGSAKDELSRAQTDEHVVRLMRQIGDAGGELLSASLDRAKQSSEALYQLEAVRARHEADKEIADAARAFVKTLTQEAVDSMMRPGGLHRGQMERLIEMMEKVAQHWDSHHESDKRSPSTTTLGG